MNIYQISIHAPTRGATTSALSCITHTGYFNPRSHEGSDKSGKHTVVYSVISIHAPTRGATQAWSILHGTQRFQSTLPRGERPTHVMVAHSMWNFNPRSHEGSDSTTKTKEGNRYISIHAPTRGATSSVFSSFTGSVFQSTLPRGERRRFCILVLYHVHFNPRSHEGSDGEAWTLTKCKRDFNPRSHEGSDDTA